MVSFKRLKKAVVLFCIAFSVLAFCRPVPAAAKASLPEQNVTEFDWKNSPDQACVQEWMKLTKLSNNGIGQVEIGQTTTGLNSEEFKAWESNFRADDSYQWSRASDKEVEFLWKQGKISFSGISQNGACMKRLQELRLVNGSTNAGKWATRTQLMLDAQLAAQINKMWKDSKLTGSSNSKGAITKDPLIYMRYENTGLSYQVPVIGVDLSNNKQDGVVEKISGFVEMIMDFFSWLAFYVADTFYKILETCGMTLDSIIFGRVAGYGIIIDKTPVSLFSFELQEGNPYGFVAAVLFQRIRMYMYSFLAILCLIKLVRIAAGNDYVKLKEDTKAFLGDVFLAFSLIVMMPYLLDLYLYIRDMILKSVTFQTLQDLFGSSGFLESYRKNAVDSEKEFVSCLLFLGAVGVAVFLAAIYISYAMSMMVHFALFPFVCLRGLNDRRAYGEWAKTTVSLTVMPIADGIVLTIPLMLSNMAGGNMAFNFLALIACAMILTVRSQVRETLGIQSNGLDMKAIGMTMALGHLARGIGNSVKNSIGKAKGAADSFSQAKEDRNMADYYSKEVSNPLKDDAGDGVSGPSPNANADMHANLRNFDDPALRGKISNEKMKELYQKRARKNMLKGFGQAGGAVGSAGGALAGGAIMGGLTSFYGGSVAMTALGLGMGAGSSVGGVGGEMAVNAAALATKGAAAFGRTSLNSAYRLGSRTMLENPAPDIPVPNIPVPTTPLALPDPNAKEREKELTESVNEYLGVSDGRKTSVAREYLNCAGAAAENLENTQNSGARAEIMVSVDATKEKLDGLVAKREAGCREYQAKHKNSDRKDFVEKELQTELQKSFDSVKRAFGREKEGFLEKEFASQLSASKQLQHDASNEVHAHAAKVILKANIDTTPNEATHQPNGPLAREGRYMSDTFDRKNYGIDWEDYRKKILGNQNQSNDFGRSRNERYGNGGSRGGRNA